MKVLRLVSLLSIALMLSAQRPAFNGALAGGDPVLAGAVAAYFMNDTAPSPWATPARNMLLSSGDLTVTWGFFDATINSATTLTFTAQYGRASQNLGSISGVKYTHYVRGRTITGNLNLQLYHGSATEGHRTAKTFTASLADYAVTVTGDGGTITYGIEDANSSGWGQIEVTRFAVYPGTWTAAQCAAMYQATTTRQAVLDKSGNGNNGVLGADANVGTGDPAYTPTSRNGAIAGTAKNLQSTSWVKTDATAGSATVFTPSALDGQIVQAFTGISGAKYRVSALIASAGNTDLEWTLDAVETAVTVTASSVRYSIEYTGDGAAANIGLRDPNAAGFGAITFTEFQIEQVPSGSAATPFTDPAEPSIMGLSLGPDDLITGAGTLGASWTATALIRPTDVTSVGLWRNGAANPAVSIDSDSIPKYTNGTDVVRASYPNLLVSYENMTDGTVWAESGSGTIDDATHYTFVAKDDFVQQVLPSTEGTSYTYYVRGRNVSGNTDLELLSSQSGSGSAVPLTFTGTLADYATVRLGKIGGGNIFWGIRDRNAAGFGQIEVTKWAVFQGSYTVEQAAALYVAASTYKIPMGLWSSLTVVNNAGTIQFYLNGTALGSGTTAASNAFTGLQIGYDGANYFAGQFADFLSYNAAKTATQVAAIAKMRAQRYWDYRGLPARGVTGVDFTVAPTLAQLLREAEQWIWARLLPQPLQIMQQFKPGGVR